jgi:hypothetical protein
MASPSKSNNFDVHSYNSYPIGTADQQQENALPMSVLPSTFLQPLAAPTEESFQNFQNPPKRFSSWGPRRRFIVILKKMSPLWGKKILNF